MQIRLAKFCERLFSFAMHNGIGETLRKKPLGENIGMKIAQHDFQIRVLRSQRFNQFTGDKCLAGHNRQANNFRLNLIDEFPDFLYPQS